jgi:hypothetical protein
MTFQISNSQPSLVTISIKADSSVTSGKVVFHCTITNPTNKKYRYFDFDPTCKESYSPEFWKIVIRKDTTNYMDCSLDFVLRHRAKPEIKLYKNSIRTFDFCLNFNKLCSGSGSEDLYKLMKPKANFRQWIKDYTNELYGVYEVQIIYLKDPHDPGDQLSLISNWTNIKYVHN